MVNKKTLYILAFDGAPRSVKEAESFFKEKLFCNLKNRSLFGGFLSKLFGCITIRNKALKRAKAYHKVNDKGFVCSRVEKLAMRLEAVLNSPVIVFHRYVTESHIAFIESVNSILYEEVVVLPLFPHYSKDLSGNIALWFKKNLSKRVLDKMVWIRSFGDHPVLINSFQKNIRIACFENTLDLREVFLLFLSQGTPLKEKDIYVDECFDSYHKIIYSFPCSKAALAFYSFDQESVQQPNVSNLVDNIQCWYKGHKNILIVPISCLVDTFETVSKIDKEYIPLLKKKGYRVFRIAPPDYDIDFIEGLRDVITTCKRKYSNEAIASGLN